MSQLIEYTNWMADFQLICDSVIKRGWGGCHAQRKLTAHLLGLIRAVLALGPPVANPLIGDARPILTLELISLTFVFY